jgi:hypothetical protein
MVGQVERHALGLLRNAGIARGAIESLDQRTIRDFPGQSVLSPTGTQEENVHLIRSCYSPLRGLTQARKQPH